MQEQEVFDHIEAGRHQELYHEWAESGTWSVRYKLARKGYELDTLVRDKNEIIRDTAMMQHPEKVPEYLNSDPNMEQMYRNMLNLTYVDSRILTCQITYWTDEKGYDSEIGHNIVSTLKTKKAAIEEVPSLIQTTMTPTELYKAGSHLWAKDLRVQEVDNVLFYLDCSMDFEEAYNQGTSYHNTTPNKYT